MKRIKFARITSKTYFVCIILATVITFVVIATCIDKGLFVVARVSEKDVLLIDPGHGGFDGGAESFSGIPEKDINLNIALKLRDIAIKDGWQVVMTREEDVSLEGDTKGSIRSRKTADITARRQLIRDTEPELTVSIHLNSFKEDRSVRGAQVFYPEIISEDENNPALKSKVIAETVQKSLVETLNDGTDRKAMEKSGVGILRDCLTPIILVECGFLSNNDDLYLLKNDEYQYKFANAVYSGIMISFGKTGENVERLRIIDSL